MGAPLRVCLDGRGPSLPRGTGVATYAGTLMRCLPLAGCEAQVLVDGDRHPGRLVRWAGALSLTPRPAALLPGGERRRVPDAFRTAQVHFDVWRGFLPLALPPGDPAPPAVMHWTYPLPLRLRGVPNVYTVHDLIPLLHPGLTPIDGRRMRRILDGVGRAAAHIVTVSEASRREIVTTLGWPPDRVSNTWQAVELPEMASAGPTDPTLAALAAAPHGYLLHVGTVEPRKNLARLIEAYRASGVRAPLVLAGPDGWHAAAELAPAAGLLRPPRNDRDRGGDSGPAVIRIPWLDRPALLALMQGARALLMPSLAEGFGLPVVEAMALGTPVLTSNSGALAEVAGDAASCVDPLDVRAMAEAMGALDRDAGLRASLAARGRTRAKLFTPEAYAARLQTLYARLAAERPAG